MRKIYTIGETVLDIIFKNGQPVASKAGGSMLNTAVSLGRLGLPVHFISEYATDQVGIWIDHFLNENGVSTEYVYRFKDGKSALALAFLDENNNAGYTFYKSYPKQRFASTFPEIDENDVVMFGSIYGVATEIRDVLYQFLLYAKSRKALIYYDPNFRKAHIEELEIFRPAIIQNIALADVVRASDEDLSIIFGVSNADEAYEVVKPLCGNLIYTASSDAVYVRTSTCCNSFPTRKINPLSTIGAGDTFNAGIGFGIFCHAIDGEMLHSLSPATWQYLIGYAIDFATEVCLSYENYISVEFAKKQTGF